MTDAVLERLQALSDRVDEYRVRQRSEMQRLTHDIAELRNMMEERDTPAAPLPAALPAAPPPADTGELADLADEFRVFKAAIAQQLTEMNRALSTILTEMGSARSHTVVSAPAPPPPPIAPTRALGNQARELGNAVLTDLRQRWRRSPRETR